jgi:hypothetical protein
VVASPAIPPPLSRRFSVVYISVFFSLFLQIKPKKEVLGLLVCDSLILFNLSSYPGLFHGVAHAL